MTRGMRCSGHRAGKPERRAARRPGTCDCPLRLSRGSWGVGSGSFGKEVFDLMSFDVAAVRGAYPALADGYASLDGAAGTQVPSVVIEAISGAYRSGIGNAGGLFPASIRSATLTAECRAAVADLTGGVTDGVILGPNMTTLTYRLASALARSWDPDDEVLASRLDHDSNVRPWGHAATPAGAMVRG